MTGRPKLEDRQSQVLASLVYEYIATGDPVGSRTLARHYDLGVSAATIRNTMSELEEMGLAYHPHTSAGRVPTDLGLRIFVEALMEVRDLTPAEREHIRGRVGDVPSAHDRWEQTGRLLSEVTQQAAVVLSPRPEGMVLAEVRFVPLTSGEVLALLVGESGIVLHRPFRVSEVPTPARLDRIHNYLNELVPGKTLAGARDALAEEMLRSQRSLDAMKAQAFELGRGAFGEPADDPRLVVHGQGRLVLGRGRGDADRMRHLVELLEDQDTLVELLDATIAAEGTRLVIGTEHPLTGDAHCAVVAAPYRHGGDSRGSLAVIGPRSMDYCRVMPLVEFTARVISDSSSRDA